MKAKASPLSSLDDEVSSGQVVKTRSLSSTGMLTHSICEILKQGDLTTQNCDTERRQLTHKQAEEMRAEMSYHADRVRATSLTTENSSYAETSIASQQVTKHARTSADSGQAKRKSTQIRTEFLSKTKER